MAVQKILAVFFVLASIVSPIVFAGPQLVSDISAGPEWVAANDLHVTKAECTKWQGVVSTCSIDYSESNLAKITSELHYFVYGSWGGEHAQLLRSVRNASIVTTSQALRDLGARKTTLAIWILFCGSVLVLTLMAIICKPGHGHSSERDAEWPSGAGDQSAAVTRSTEPVGAASPRDGAMPKTFGRRVAGPASAGR